MITHGGSVVGGVAAAAGTKPTFTIYDHAGTTLGAGWIVPEFEGVDVNVQASESSTANYQGEIIAVHFSGEYFEASFRLKPFATLNSDARLSATILRPGYTMYVTGMPVIAAAPFTDIFNCSSTTVSQGTIQTHRWIISSNGISLSNAGSAGKSVTARRYEKIGGGVAITT